MYVVGKVYDITLPRLRRLCIYGDLDVYNEVIDFVPNKYVIQAPELELEYLYIRESHVCSSFVLGETPLLSRTIVDTFIREIPTYVSIIKIMQLLNGIKNTRFLKLSSHVARVSSVCFALLNLSHIYQ